MRLPSSGRDLAGVLPVAWFGVLAALMLWLRRTPPHVLRQQLRELQFWSLELCVVLGLAIVVPVLWGLVRRVDRAHHVRLALLAAAAVAFTLFVAPRTNRIYYDEQIYQSIGQSLSDLKLAQMCNDGHVEYGYLRCASGEYNKQPHAYPHLLSVAYRVFGVHERVAFGVNAAAFAALVCGVYLIVLTLFADTAAAWLAGLLMLLIPQQIMWSATAAVEPTASLACVAALLCAAAFVRERSSLALAATAVAAAYAVQFRPESFLIIPVIGCVLLPIRRELGLSRASWSALLFVVLVAVHVGHMFAVRGEGWGTNEARLSLRYVGLNLSTNGWFYLGDPRFPFVTTLLAAAGIAARGLLLHKLTLVLYFLLFFVMYLLFYAGSYNYGADVRYSLMTYPPIAMAGGLGAAAVARWIERLQPRLAATTAVSAALIFGFLSYLPLVRATTEEAWAARADVRFARSLAPALRGNTYVLTHNPGIFHVWGINAGQMSHILTNPQHLDALAARYTGGVYLHWNFWCNVQDPVQSEFCRRALARAPADLVHEYKERDQRFAMYRLRPRT